MKNYYFTRPNLKNFIIIFTICVSIFMLCYGAYTWGYSDGYFNGYSVGVDDSFNTIDSTLKHYQMPENITPQRPIKQRVFTDDMFVFTPHHSFEFFNL